MAAPAPQRLLGGLTASQREAVTSEAGVLCVVAGAGSGKTTVLTRRIAWREANGTADAERSLVVTFTRKAAGELRDRLGRLGAGGVWAGTFHAAAFAQLRRHWADSGRQAPAVLAEPRRILRALVDDDPHLDGDATAALATELAWSRARMVDPDGYVVEADAARRRPGLPLDHVAAILARYRAEKERRRLIDLDDLVVECAMLLEAGGPTAEAVRWRFRHLFVDEFQDVNPAQWRLLCAWHGDRKDLCVVGDPRQAIYAWNGSDPSLLGRLPSLLPDVEVVRLDDNHRSSPQIVAAATAVLEQAPAGEEASGAEELPVAAGLVDGPPPTVLGFDDEADEAVAVARWLRRTRRPGQPWRHHAVLARTNARLGQVAGALTRAGIPYRHAGRRDDEGSLSTVLRALRTAERRTPLRAALVDALAEAADTAPDGADGASEAAELLTRLADEYAAEEPGPTVGGFLGWLAVNPGAAELPSARRDGVELATFHRAKGLEWPAVAVIGLEDGTVPIVYASGAAARAEERRLFYVALTRAERDLWCSWAARGADGNGRDRAPSPFLDAVRGAAGSSAPLTPAAAARRVAELRSRLPAAG